MEKENEIWELIQSLQVLKEDLEEMDRTCVRKFGDFMAVLEAMEDRCDSILYQAGLLDPHGGKERAGGQNNTPDGE